jgi:hypothetical protein
VGFWFSTSLVPHNVAWLWRNGCVYLAEGPDQLKVGSSEAAQQALQRLARLRVGLSAGSGMAI